MKKKSLILIAIMLIAGSISTEVFAQEAIKALVKKCENMQNVNINIVRSRNKDTKKLERVVKNISFSNDKILADEFIAAFEKDREMADKEIENMSNGKLDNLFYRFGNSSYSFSYDKEGGSVSITVIEREDD